MVPPVYPVKLEITDLLADELVRLSLAWHTRSQAANTGRRPSTQQEFNRPVSLPPPVLTRLSVPAAPTQVPEESLHLVKNIVLRFNSELKAVYRHYAALYRTPAPASGDAHGAKTFMLRMGQFWRCITDCKLNTKDLTLAAIDILVQVRLPCVMRSPINLH